MADGVWKNQEDDRVVDRGVWKRQSDYRGGDNGKMIYILNDFTKIWLPEDRKYSKTSLQKKFASIGWKTKGGQNTQLMKLTKYWKANVPKRNYGDVQADEFKARWLGFKSRDSIPKHQNKQRMFCWHFIRGYCKRGETCIFQHCSSVAHSDAQKVFLGGLPFHVTQESLKLKLKEMGFNVINTPVIIRIVRGYSPQVCLGSADEAQRLIKKGTILFDGYVVDIRPYRAVTQKQQQRIIDVTKRSIFLGGLAKDTTVQMIWHELSRLGVKVVNRPVVKARFCPQVILATVQQAEMLVSKAKLQVNGVWVDVRQYQHFNRLTGQSEGLEG